MDGFKADVRLHQRSVPESLLFVMLMDKQINELRQESPWMIMFADDIVICSESRGQVANLERWRYDMETGMKVSSSKKEYKRLGGEGASAGRVETSFMSGL